MESNFIFDCPAELHDKNPNFPKLLDEQETCFHREALFPLFNLCDFLFFVCFCGGIILFSLT